MKNVTIIFNKKMKMADLIDADYRLLMLLTRLNITLGFGEKSVEETCLQHDFDPDCFVFLANFQSNRSIINLEKVFDALPLEPFIYYLNASHAYFLDDRLPNIRRKLVLVFSEDEHLKALVLRFFDDYMQEVREHMEYEDEVVFPYVRKLLAKEDLADYSIDIFQDRHNDIDDKVRDLKQILLKYVEGSKDQILMTNVLLELYMSEEELEAHTFIEDHLIIPRVGKLEQQ